MLIARGYDESNMHPRICSLPELNDTHYPPICDTFMTYRGIPSQQRLVNAFLIECNSYPRDKHRAGPAFLKPAPDFRPPSPRQTLAPSL